MRSCTSLSSSFGVVVRIAHDSTMRPSTEVQRSQMPAKESSCSIFRRTMLLSSSTRAHFKDHRLNSSRDFVRRRRTIAERQCGCQFPVVSRGGFIHSVRKACAGSIEAARSAGINPAKTAATIMIDTATAKTPVLIALISYNCEAT
jgi:hypothetical protein